MDKPPSHAVILVRADWDDDAKVWVATSADIDGLATEAATLEELRDKVLAMVGELAELNGLVVRFAGDPGSHHVRADGAHTEP